MADRYFSENPILSDTITLGGAEAHHLIHVMRAKPGSRVVVFDGSGAEFAARVEWVGRGEVRVEVVSREEVDRELPREVTLGVALPKGDRQRWLVEKAVELGIARLVPLRTARSVAVPVRQAIERLRRTVVEASKQCGRNRLMEIAEPRAWSDYVEHGDQCLGGEATEEETAGQKATVSIPHRLVAHPGGRPIGEIAALLAARCHPIFLAIGPEGGLAADEVAQATAAGWRPVDLGPRILRIETAALLLTAAVVS